MACTTALCAALADPELAELAELADVDTEADEKKPRRMRLASLNRGSLTSYFTIDPIYK